MVDMDSCQLPCLLYFEFMQTPCFLQSFNEPPQNIRAVTIAPIFARLKPSNNFTIATGFLTTFDLEEYKLFYFICIVVMQLLKKNLQA